MIEAYSTRGEAGEIMRIETQVVSLIFVALMILSFADVSPVCADFGAATICVQPEFNLFTHPPTNINDTFTVNVRIANYTHVAGWQVKLLYDARLLSTTTDCVGYSSDFVFPSGSYPPIPSSVNHFNSTYDYVMMTTTTYGAVECNGSDAGLMDITFTIVKEPTSHETLSCVLRLEPVDTWSINVDLVENDETLIDSCYKLEWISPPPPHLAMTPPTMTLPMIPGDMIIGQHFFWPIWVRHISAEDQVIRVEYEITWDPTWIELVWLWEGTFMNNSAWAPHGTFDNVTGWLEDGRARSFILILPNETTGEWDWGVFPEDDGLLATAEFVVVNQTPEPADPVINVTLPSVYGEYFFSALGHCVKAGPAENGTLILNGYFWHPPVALKTYTPTMPVIYEIVRFDASASFDPDPWDHIVSYTWDFGDGNITTVTTPIVYHRYTEGGDYIVKLTVTDTMGKNGTEIEVVTVLLDRQIDVYVCYPDPFGGQGLNRTADMFWPQKTVCVKVNVTYNGNPVQFKPVAFQIKSPNGEYDFCETNVTDENGYCWIDFGLPWPCEDWNDTFGIWTIIAKVDIRCVVVEDWLWFKVWWLAEVTSVESKAIEYHYCEDAEFFIKIRTYARQRRNFLITLSVFDELDVCVGNDYTWITMGQQHPWCGWLYYNLTLSVHIPKWVFIGKGTAKVNVFWPDWPEFCGSPMCLQVAVTFKITLP
jgi:PKD repeat protein